MVKYQKFISLAFDEAKGQGMEFNSLEQSNNALQLFAQLWSENKDEIKAFAVREAKEYLHDQIDVEL